MISVAHMLGGSGSGVPRGGGAASPGRRLKGAPKSCQNFFLIYIWRNFKNLKEKTQNVVIILFDYILDFSAPPPPPHHKINNNIFMYLNFYSILAPPPLPVIKIVRFVSQGADRGAPKSCIRIVYL